MSATRELTDQAIAEFLSAPGLERGRYALVVSVRWRPAPGWTPRNGPLTVSALVPEAFGRVVDDATGEGVEA